MEVDPIYISLLIIVVFTMYVWWQSYDIEENSEGFMRPTCTDCTDRTFGKKDLLVMNPFKFPFSGFKNPGAAYDKYPKLRDPDEIDPEPAEVKNNQPPIESFKQEQDHDYYTN